MIYIRKGIYNQLETAFGQQNSRIKKVEQIVYNQHQQQQELIQLLQSPPMIHPYMGGAGTIPIFQPVNPVQPVYPVQPSKPVESDSVPLSPKISNPPSSPKMEPIPQESMEDLDALLKEELAELEKSGEDSEQLDQPEEPIEEIATDSLKKTT